MGKCIITTVNVHCSSYLAFLQSLGSLLLIGDSATDCLDCSHVCVSNSVCLSLSVCVYSALLQSFSESTVEQ